MELLVSLSCILKFRLKVTKVWWRKSMSSVPGAILSTCFMSHIIVFDNWYLFHQADIECCHFHIWLNYLTSYIWLNLSNTGNMFLYMEIILKRTCRNNEDSFWGTHFETLFIHLGLCTLTIEFFTIDVSVRLSDRSLQKEEQKKNSSKITPSGDWNKYCQILRPMLYQLS